MIFLRINLPNFVQFKANRGDAFFVQGFACETWSAVVEIALNGRGSFWNSFRAKEENILATRNFFLPQTAAPWNRRPCSAEQFEHTGAEQK